MRTRLTLLSAQDGRSELQRTLVFLRSGDSTFLCRLDQFSKAHLLRVAAQHSHERGPPYELELQKKTHAWTVRSTGVGASTLSAAAPVSGAEYG